MPSTHRSGAPPKASRTLLLLLLRLLLLLLLLLLRLLLELLLCGLGTDMTSGPTVLEVAVQVQKGFPMSCDNVGSIGRCKRATGLGYCGRGATDTTSLSIQCVAVLVVAVLLVRHGVGV